MDKMDPMLFINNFLPFFNDIQILFGILFGERLKRIQTFTEFRQSNGNHGHACHTGGVPGEIPDRALQLFFIIYILAENDLAVHRNLRLIERVNLFQGVTCEAVVQHQAPQLRICALDGYVNRCQPVLDNPVNILILHVGQRDIITLKEGKSGIVILEIEGFPHSRRHLVDKAENTLISAGAIIAHQPILKGQAQILVFIFNIQFPLFPIFLSDDHGNGLIVNSIFIIKNIFDFIAVYGQKHIARFQFKLLRDRAGIDPADQMSVFYHT